MLEWVIAEGCPISNILGKALLRNGDLQLLEWALREEMFINHTIGAAMESYKLEVVQWYYQHFHTLPDTESIIMYATEEILEWLLQQNLIKLSAELCMGMCKFGRFNMLICLRQHGCPWNPQECIDGAQNTYNNDLMRWSAPGEYLGMIQWIQQHS